MVTDCVAYGLCPWVGTHVKNDHVFGGKLELEAGGGPCVFGFELDVVKRAPTRNPFGEIGGVDWTPEARFGYFLRLYY
jgi:hypothetical protein